MGDQYFGRRQTLDWPLTLYSIPSTAGSLESPSSPPPHIHPSTILPTHTSLNLSDLLFLVLNSSTFLPPKIALYFLSHSTPFPPPFHLPPFDPPFSALPFISNLSFPPLPPLFPPNLVSCPHYPLLPSTLPSPLPPCLRYSSKPFLRQHCNKDRKQPLRTVQYMVQSHKGKILYPVALHTAPNRFMSIFQIALILRAV